MISRMFMEDVFVFSVVFVVFLVSFSAAGYVLRAGSEGLIEGTKNDFQQKAELAVAQAYSPPNTPGGVHHHHHYGAEEEEVDGYTFGHELEETFESMFGNFDLSWYDFSNTAKGLHILYVVLSTILLFNTLIAKMSKTFEAIQQNAVLVWKIERARIMDSLENEDSEQEQKSMSYWVAAGKGEAKRYFVEVSEDDESYYNQDENKEKVNLEQQQIPQQPQNNSQPPQQLSQQHQLQSQSSLQMLRSLPPTQPILPPQMIRSVSEYHENQQPDFLDVGMGVSAMPHNNAGNTGDFWISSFDTKDDINFNQLPPMISPTTTSTTATITAAPNITNTAAIASASASTLNSQQIIDQKPAQRTTRTPPISKKIPNASASLSTRFDIPEFDFDSPSGTTPLTPPVTSSSSSTPGESGGSKRGLFGRRLSLIGRSKRFFSFGSSKSNNSTS